MQKHPGNSEKLAISDFGVEVHTPQFFKVPAEEHVVLIDATCLECLPKVPPHLQKQEMSRVPPRSLACPLL
jgi:hypothetical protein